MKRMILALLCAFMISTSALSQEVKYLRIGSLHSWFRSDGSEPWQGDPPASDFQYGLQWPADERNQDCLNSKGLWIGTTDFCDHAQYGGKNYRYKVVHCGPRHADPKHEFIPVYFKLAGRFPYPQVSVDGLLDPELYTTKKMDIIDPQLASDLMLINVVNTSIGITMTRKIMAWSHAEHNNYFIYDYTFTNSGNIDADPEIEKQTTLQDVWFYFQYRYAPSKEPVMYGAWLPGSASWGRATMLDVRGENPSKGDPFRALFAWLGKHSQWQGPGDNIGAPDYQRDGHFSATQYLGVLTLHADKSPVDHADDPYQPRTTHYIDSDAGINLHNDPLDSAGMALEYAAMSRGHANLRHANAVGQGFADLFGETAGGYSHGQGFGPYTLQPGESVHIVLAEAVDGLSRKVGTAKGALWLNNKAPFALPNGTYTNDRNQFKNTWVATGQDSLFRTFQRARSNFSSGYAVPSAPPPPAKFIVTSQFAKISLQWSAESEMDPHFAGYRIYRVIPDYGYDQSPMKIFECGPGTAHPAIVHHYDDIYPARGFAYQYTVVAFNDGANNGGIPLVSSSHWTAHTFKPAYLVGQQPVQADLYVSPQGDDSNSGLAPDVPLKTINKALGLIQADFTQPRTIYLAPGTYSPTATGENYPLKGKHYVNIKGADKLSTILCAEEAEWAVTLEYDTQGFSLEDLSIIGGRNSLGGAISGRTTELALKNVILARNAGTALYLSGAGGNLTLNKVAIRDNGNSGLVVVNAQMVSLSSVSITGNNGDGANFYYCNDVHFDENNRSNIYYNGLDLGASYGGADSQLINTVLDTFTVLYPTSYHADPVAAFRFDILHGLEKQVAADLYVSPTGDDSNDGTSADKPLLTLEHAIRTMIPATLDFRTLYLADGIYSQSTTGEAFPIRCPSYTTIQGKSPGNTIIDGEARYARAFYCHGVHGVEIKNLTIKSYFSESLYVSWCYWIFLRRLVLFNNRESNSPRGLYLSNSDRIRLINCTIADNGKADGNYSAGLYCYGSSALILNSILGHNEPYEIKGDHSSIDIAFSDVDSTKIAGTVQINRLEGTISSDPHFRDVTAADFSLQQSSPCIDAATASYHYFYYHGPGYYSEFLVDLQPGEFNGSAPDMGALENNGTGASLRQISALPVDYELAQNYPNPFNASTMISYTIPRKEHVRIELFNNLGQKLFDLVDKSHEPGQYTLNFDSASLSSGIYFFKMQAGHFSAIRKSLVVK